MKHTYRRRISAAALLGLMISSTVAPVAWPKALTLSPTEANQKMQTRLTIGDKAPQVSIFNDKKRAGAAAAATVLAILINHMAQSATNALMTADKKGLPRSAKQVAKDVALALVSPRKLAQVGLGSLLSVFKKDATRDASSTVAKRLYAWFMANKVFTVLSFAEFVGAVYFIFFRENNEWARRSEWNKLVAELDGLTATADLALDKTTAKLADARAAKAELDARSAEDTKAGITGTIAERKEKTAKLAEWRKDVDLELAPDATYNVANAAANRWNSLQDAGCIGDKLSEKETSLLTKTAELKKLVNEQAVLDLASDEVAAQLAHALSLLAEKPALTPEVEAALNARQAAHAKTKAAAEAEEDAKFEAACATLVADLDKLTPAELMTRYNAAKKNPTFGRPSVEFKQLEDRVTAWQATVDAARQAAAQGRKVGDILKTVSRNDGNVVYVQIAGVTADAVTFKLLGGENPDKDSVVICKDPSNFTFAPTITETSSEDEIAAALADLETLHDETKAVTSYQARVAALTAQLEAKRKAAEEALHGGADVPPAADEDLPATKMVWVMKAGKPSLVEALVRPDASGTDIQPGQHFMVGTKLYKKSNTWAGMVTGQNISEFAPATWSEMKTVQVSFVPTDATDPVTEDAYEVPGDKLPVSAGFKENDNIYLPALKRFYWKAADGNWNRLQQESKLVEPTEEATA